MKNIFNRWKKPVTETSVKEAADKTTHRGDLSFMPATPALREAITSFIIQSLQPYVDEKGLAIAGLHFYIVCNDAEQEAAARVALYLDRPGMFKSGYLERKLLNHFIQLDPAWFFECHIVQDEPLPGNCIRKNNFGLSVVRSGEPVTSHYSKAMLEVLAGQAGQPSYTLDPKQQLKFYIGRTSNPQLASGKIQQNDIVFLGSDEPGFDEHKGAVNAHVSRNHAYIMYDAKTGSWLIYPDKGGLPENGNKLKVHSSNDKVNWLNIYGVPHCLTNGDQLELGGAAIIQFRLIE